MDWGQSVVFLDNTERWKKDRRMLHESLHKGVMRQHHVGQEKHVQALLARLLDTSPTLETFNDDVSL